MKHVAIANVKCSLYDLYWFSILLTFFYGKSTVHSHDQSFSVDYENYEGDDWIWEYHKQGKQRTQRNKFKMVMDLPTLNEVKVCLSLLKGKLHQIG
jgi:hypothetical protein